jgi:RimJ/RimL family protein N-acetyltransferase
MPNPLLVDVPDHFETGRLVLRSHRRGDGAVLHDALVESITELRKFLWMLPWVAEGQTQDSAEIRCRRCEANFLSRSDLPYLAFERSTGRLVGSVGLHRTDWDVPKTEVGYWIRTSEAGKGYVTEGVQVLVAWAFDQLRAERVELVVDDQNIASRRVAERCGFVLEGILRNVLRGPDGILRNTCIYARLRPAT